MESSLASCVSDVTNAKIKVLNSIRYSSITLYQIIFYQPLSWLLTLSFDNKHFKILCLFDYLYRDLNLGKMLWHQIRYLAIAIVELPLVTEILRLVCFLFILVWFWPFKQDGFRKSTIFTHSYWCLFFVFFLNILFLVHHVLLHCEYLSFFISWCNF